MFHMTWVKYLQQARNKMIQTLPPVKVILGNISNTEQLYDIPQNNTVYFYNIHSQDLSMGLLPSISDVI